MTRQYFAKGIGWPQPNLPMNLPDESLMNPRRSTKLPFGRLATWILPVISA